MNFLPRWTAAGYLCVVSLGGPGRLSIYRDSTTNKAELWGDVAVNICTHELPTSCLSCNYRSVCCNAALTDSSFLPWCLNGFCGLLWTPWFWSLGARYVRKVCAPAVTAWHLVQFPPLVESIKRSRGAAHSAEPRSWQVGGWPFGQGCLCGLSVQLSKSLKLYFIVNWRVNEQERRWSVAPLHATPPLHNSRRRSVPATQSARSTGQERF